MENYIKNIKVKKIFHLQNFEIPISDERFPHLFITGKNGSGKTILLDAIGKYLSEYGLRPRSMRPSATVFNIELNSISNYNENLLFAFYVASRKPDMLEPKNPVKPNLSKPRNIKDGLTSQFIRFLVDLKIQEALARNENEVQDANNIAEWFSNFEQLLGVIYEDNDLKITFNYKNYTFLINTDGKSFKFTELSDGFAAIIEIISDLILKMQQVNSLVRAYEQKGVVLIDEIETHLHLGLQRNIMPLLTKVFPNIQFIVTTHSPFVLSSLPNAVAFDLEHREIIDNLNEYSYEALAEGYFGVKTSSSYLEMRLNELKKLLQKTDIAPNEKFEIKRLLEDLGGVSEAVSPIIVGQFNELRLKYVDVIKSL